jgi:hypothetical protein
MQSAGRLTSQPDAMDALRPEDLIREAIETLNWKTVLKEFDEQGQFVFVPRFLPDEYVARMLAEVKSFSSRDIHRTYVPWMRKAGTIGQGAIARRAPYLYALYRSPNMLQFTSQLAGVPLSLKNEVDAHAAALYVYRKPGDHVGFHYDSCGCEDQLSYTATFGVINDTASRVHFQLFRKHPERELKELRLSMEPGSFVFFCGSRAYHRVTPLGPNEERVTFSFAYVREGRRLRGFSRFTENVKDAVLYFGPKAIFQKNYG